MRGSFAMQASRMSLLKAIRASEYKKLVKGELKTPFLGRIFQNSSSPDLCICICDDVELRKQVRIVSA